MNPKFLIAGGIFIVCVTLWPGLLSKDLPALANYAGREVVTLAVRPTNGPGLPVIFWIIVGIIVFVLATRLAKGLR